MLTEDGADTLNSYLEVLSTFRPAQTILEIDASKQVCQWTLCRADADKGV